MPNRRAPLWGIWSRGRFREYLAECVLCFENDDPRGGLRAENAGEDHVSRRFNRGMAVLLNLLGGSATRAEPRDGGREERCIGPRSRFAPQTTWSRGSSPRARFPGRDSDVIAIA